MFFVGFCILHWIISSKSFVVVVVVKFLGSSTYMIMLFINFLMFIFEREREKKRERERALAGEGPRERDTQNLKQVPSSELSAQSLTQGSNS